MSKLGKILVAMSGGIDSTVTALLLHEAGYEVIGITMKTWDYTGTGVKSKKETGCCSLDSLQDARKLAVDLGFHHFILDIRDEFGEAVIENFVDEYLSGRTPNPCVMCNTHIKWNALLKRANALDCEFIATGHYARTKEKAGRHYISKAKDLNKDQSYVLWGLSQDSIKRSKYPLAELTKPEVRQIAKDSGYDQLSKKAESYEICFVPENNYRDFLKHKVPSLDSDIGTGDFINRQGDILGRHEGYPYYTVGQRKGLGIALGKPMFVTDILPHKNIVVLGEHQELSRNKMVVSKLNWMKYNIPDQDKEFTTKIRYRDVGHLSTIKHEDESLLVDFYSGVNGVAPGQSAVIYEGDDIVCGGIITKSIL